MSPVAHDRTAQRQPVLTRAEFADDVAAQTVTSQRLVGQIAERGVAVVDLEQRRQLGAVTAEIAAARREIARVRAREAAKTELADEPPHDGIGHGERLPERLARVVAIHLEARRRDRSLDEPIADSAILPTYLLSKFARAAVKVVLTGEGADELFLGYPRYPITAWNARLGRWWQAATPRPLPRACARTDAFMWSTSETSGRCGRSRAGA